MNPKLLFLIGFVLALFHASHAQSDKQPLLKLGGYPIYRNHDWNGSIFSIEQEMSFKKNDILKHGYKIDYYYKNLILGYNLKLYPFFSIKKKPYQGIFIGSEICYFLPIDNRYKNGPGIATELGYQYVFKNKISAGIEIDMICMKNLNSKAFDGTSSNELNWFLIPSIKVGIKLNKNKD